MALRIPLVNPVGDVRLARLLAACVAQFRSLSPVENITGILRPLFTAGYHQLHLQATTNSPSIYIGGNDELAVVLMDGASIESHANQLLQFWNDGISPSPGSPGRDYVSLLAGRIVDLYNHPDFPRTTNWLCAGWSLGGCAVLQSATMFRQSKPGSHVRVISFGAPRTYTERGVQRLNIQDFARWMVDSDPVPLLPNALWDQLSTRLYYGTITASRWTTFRHTAGGLSIGLGGEVLALELPRIAALVPGPSLQAWYVAQSTGANTDHAIQQYVSRFDTWDQNHPPAGNVPVVGAPVERLPDIPAQQIREAEAAAVNSVFRAGREQQERPIVLPDLKSFEAKRSGRVWSILLNGVVVAVAPTRKRARGLARTGNDLLGRLLRQSRVDPKALAQEVQAWIALAQDETSGISPLLRVE